MNVPKPEQRPLGISLLIGFFWFGTAMCSLTLVLLLFPGTPLDVLWRVKPSAREELTALGVITIPLMTVVGAACASAAIGLTRGAEWGRRVAIAVLTVNIFGDLGKAALRGDWRTLIGLPIGGAMIFYLMCPTTREYIKRAGTQPHEKI